MHTWLGVHDSKQSESNWNHHKSQLLENPARDRPNHSQLQASYLMHKMPAWPEPAGSVALCEVVAPPAVCSEASYQCLLEYH